MQGTKYVQREQNVQREQKMFLYAKFKFIKSQCIEAKCYFLWFNMALNCRMWPCVALCGHFEIFFILLSE